MTERYQPGSNPQNSETGGQRSWRHFKHYYGAPLIMALGLFAAGTFGIPEGQRIIEGDFGKVTDPLELSKFMAGDLNTITNPSGQPPVDDQTGGWLIDAFAVSGVLSSLAMLGFGINLRITTGDRR